MFQLSLADNDPDELLDSSLPEVTGLLGVPVSGETNDFLNSSGVLSFDAPCPTANRVALEPLFSDYPSVAHKYTSKLGVGWDWASKSSDYEFGYRLSADLGTKGNVLIFWEAGGLDSRFSVRPYPGSLSHILSSRAVAASSSSSGTMDFACGEVVGGAPYVLEVDTPNISFESARQESSFGEGASSSSSPSKFDFVPFTCYDLDFNFINYFEFSAFYFVYVLSLYIIFALILGPNVDGEFDEFSVITLGDLSALSDSDIDNASLSAPVLGPDETSASTSNANEILLNLRKRNYGRVIIGTLNINSVASKLDQLRVIIGSNLDILTIQETKLDDSVPTADLMISGFGEPYRLDRNSHGGGVLIYVREDIPSKPLSGHSFSRNIEGLFIEINLRKTKLLFFGGYRSEHELYGAKGDDFFHEISVALDKYSNYDKFLLAGDFNLEVEEEVLDDFLVEHHAKSLVKEPTCFKSLDNPSCIDLFLTNSVQSFQNTTTVATGLSDFHKMSVTVLKTTFPKASPRVNYYRDHKNFCVHAFRGDLRSRLGSASTTQILKKLL